ncbi:ribosome silencing factor [Campylobacter gracilis]|uniref:Ribosomal silencing factor RsfS n=1 Tax=Campylobacter gracilis RM3268 TaxID=553220 RepID=C8PI07_9BACT|nr:ribosome silencing factor [Campylobacter gracilis]EEV17771.1 iojap-like protein [Campylobacter gracilis RM3268]UEB44651.1 ribosome silencing factor [Campylobacter gracilis]SUW78489.1 putative nicotinate (nicotinamide) nucleotide adenylyltransferase [Campylobacter gracilis]
MKIALFGGSFDPPHAGHDVAVKAILSSLKPDLLVIMPSFLNPFKKSFSAPPQLRLRWCRALWSDASHVEVSDYEISQNVPVPTIQSVKFLLEKYGIHDKITAETAATASKTPTAVTDRALPDGVNIAGEICADAHISGSAGEILPSKADRTLPYGIAKISSDNACTAINTDRVSISANAKNKILQGSVADEILICNGSKTKGISQSTASGISGGCKSNAGGANDVSKILSADKISSVVASKVSDIAMREISNSVGGEISSISKIPSTVRNEILSADASEITNASVISSPVASEIPSDNANCMADIGDANCVGSANSAGDTGGVNCMNGANDMHDASDVSSADEASKANSASGTDTISKLYIVVGADNLAELHKWRDFSELQKLAEFVVLTRPGYEIPRQWAALRRIEIAVDTSSSGFRRDFKGEIPPKIAAEVIKFYKRKDMQDPKQRAERIAEILNEKKAEDIQIIDMSEREYIAKLVVIATTLTSRHAASLIEELKSVLKPLGEEFLAIESGDEWSVVDLGDIIVHLISEAYRAKYNIEDFLDKLKKEQF